MQAEPGGDLRDRQRLDAQRDDRALLRRKPGGCRSRMRRDLRFHLDVRIRSVHPAGRDDERPQGGGLLAGRLWIHPGGRLRWELPGPGRALQERPDAGRRRAAPRVVGAGRTSHCWTAFFNSAMSRGLSAPPARVANRVISYARVPRLAVRSAITPSTEPALIAVTSR